MNVRRTMGVILGVVLAVLAPASNAFAAEPSGGSNLKGRQFVASEVIVKFKPGLSATAATRYGTRQLYRSPRGGFTRLRIPKGTTVEQMVNALRQDPSVEYVEPNGICRAFIAPNDSYYSYQWHLDDSASPNPFGGANGGGINVETAWDVTRGAGVVVAVLDTGVAYENYTNSWTGQSYYQAPDLAGTTFVPGFDFIENDTHPNDDHSHGTHVTGTIAQSTNNATGVAGVAFECAIMPVKILDMYGSGTAQTVADGLYFAADNGADVVNMSLGWSGGYDPGETVRAAMEYAYNAGVTLVAASGNDYGSQVSYPAAYDDYCIAVGATRYDETRSSYSNYGTSLDLTAPGGDTWVDQNEDGWPDGVLQQTFSQSNRGDFGYWFWQGTSMASPHVAGVAALVIANGTTGPDAVKAALESTAEDKGAPGWDQFYGHGIVDAGAVLLPSSAAPVAHDQATTTDEDTSIGVTLTATDPDGDPVVYSIVTPPANGSLVGAPPVVTYTPDPDFNGSDSFTFKATDDKGAGSNVATILITVDPVNDDPVAQDDEASTYLDEPLNIDVLANDVDVDGDTLTVDSVTQGTDGSVTIYGTTVTYTPDGGFNGTDTFTYIADDGTVNSNGATVTVTVESPPVAVDDPYSVDEDDVLIVGVPGVLGNDSDPGGDPLTAVLSQGTTNGVLGLGSNGSFTYTPAPDSSGIDTFTYRAFAGSRQSNLATVTITVNPLNDAPVASGDNVDTPEGTLIVVSVLSNDTDADGDALSVSGVTQGSDGSVTTNGTTVTYTPDGSFSGADAFTYTIIDGNGGSDVGTITVTVQAAALATLDIRVRKRVWRRRWWIAGAQVRVREMKDTNAKKTRWVPIRGARVEGHWSGTYARTVSGTTDARGRITTRTSWLRRSGTAVFTVDRVVKNGTVYSLTGEVTDSIGHP